MQTLDTEGNRRRWDLTATDLAPTNSFNPKTGAIRFFMGAAAYSSANREAELNAVRAAFGQWQSVPGTALRFEEGGLLEGDSDVNTSDGTNVVYWATQSGLVNGGRDSVLGTLALTFTRVTPANAVFEGDIVLNGIQVKWFTDVNDLGNAGQLAESTVLHEIGHLIGLDHSPVGGATMLARSLKGVGAQLGLSSDEILAAQAIYPRPGLASARLEGRVTAGGGAVFGAVVTLENEAGNVVAGTVTDAAGNYALNAPAEGRYFARVTPFDPPAANSLQRLLAGTDISPAYSGANAGFLPLGNQAATLSFAAAQRMDFAVTAGLPAFRITRIAPPRSDTTQFTAVNAPAQIRPGDSNLFVGVCSPDLPTGNATLAVTGGGVQLGPARFVANAFPGSNPALNLIYARIDVSNQAAPGLRSLLVTQGTSFAYANGFLEILPTVPDYNFDGLDDRFQRRFFPLFTAGEARPEADPDQDGASNSDEAAAWTSPVDSGSALRVETVAVTQAGARVVWNSVPGRRYRVWSREAFPGAGWIAAGTATASGSTTEILDRANVSNQRFYRVEVIQ